jgi:hypothetical protein
MTNECHSPKLWSSFVAMEGKGVQRKET